MLKYSIQCDEVLKNFEKIRKEFPDKLEEVVYQTLSAGVRSAVYTVPVDTATLQESISIDVMPIKKDGVVKGSYQAVAWNKNGKNYGYYQEVGWTDKAGIFHEGKFYMYSSKLKAEATLKKLTNQLLGRYCRK